ncbi:DEAD/DEAH box helicase [Paenibacillus eucommiae]|uniref:ATP-dependent Lhr-like helicase n=1 Tax=Paenibacillus eucommiae TaxID=1355755 RepID=A0ABS4J0D8_9BACL|nr:DEAD/DEAH box helicase [Paenibacillus eucommiae]MBP1993308.1 ATP-dependent Lhr-like helicase [Paenibacillus eucommiae]
MADAGIQEYGFHPVLEKWFIAHFKKPTAVQIEAWRQIGEGSHTLISSPTGSGKTLAALLPCLDRIAKSKLSFLESSSENRLENSTKNKSFGYKPGVRVLYVTPLKALNNDIEQHLFRFLEEIEHTAIHMPVEAGSKEPGHAWAGISVAVRTGDTSRSTRASMLKQPPDLLVTTPESLYLLLTSPRAREILKTVEQIIVDEIHDLAADKRGLHLSLTLERLAVWCGRPVQRIGVSATQKPIESVAQFLGGWENDQPRKVAIVESIADKRYELLVTMPEPALNRGDKEAVWTPLVERILQLMEGCRTALVFANSRRLCERLTLRLNDHVGHEIARSHHGSVAREKRLEVERQLKAGELRCLVATSSLELGIDVGHVDLVIQIDSPLSAASGIQRIGRAGHAVGDVSRGVLLARSRGLLPELAVLSRRIKNRDIEAIRIPRNGLAVLAQQIVAMVAMDDDWNLARLERMLAQSDSYCTLPPERLTAMLQVLAGFFPFVRPLLTWDRDTGLLQRLPATPMAALIGAGTIPQSTAFPVHHNETSLHLGELDEEFVHESSVGDVFQLGTASWRIVRIRHDRVYVAESANRYSEIPFWRGEAGGRSYELGRQTGELWRELSQRLQAGSGESLGGDGQPSAARTQRDLDALEWLSTEYAFDAEAGRSLLNLIHSQLAVNTVPTDQTVVIEVYADEHNQTHVVLHSLFGRIFNRTWLMAIDKKLRHKNCPPIFTNAKDNGIELIFPNDSDVIIQTILSLTAGQAERLIIDAIAESSMFPAVFRRLAETSLLLSRSFTRMPAWKKRLRSEELLKEAMPYKEDFPLLQETMRECIEEHLDITNVKQLLTSIALKHTHIAIHRNHFPSPLAGQFMFDYTSSKLYESDGLTRELQLELMGFSRQIAGELFGTEALKQAVDPEVIKAEEQRLEGSDQPAQSPADLLRQLKERGDMSLAELRSFAGEPTKGWLNELLSQHSIVSLPFPGDTRYACKDESELYAVLSTSESARLFILKRYTENRLSFTTAELADRYGLPAEIVTAWIQAGVEQGFLQQAPFAISQTEALWSSTKVASRLIRLSLQAYRRNREALSPLVYLQHLLLRQGLTTVLSRGAALKGSSNEGDSFRDVIRNLEGFFLPLSLWEAVLFPARMPAYKKQDLDQMCAAGEVFWVGRKDPEEKEGRIAFFLAESSLLFEPFIPVKKESAHPALLALLRERGARFLSKLAIETDQQPSLLLSELLELVWEGHAANDQFSPLRLHAQGGNKKNDKFHSGLGRWYAFEEPTPAYNAEESAVKWTHHLLERYGIITKDLVAAFSPFSWDTIIQVLKQFEEWGIVVRGLFIETLPQLQFTTKEFLSSLQQPTSLNHTDGLILLPSVDPANPFGLMLPWPTETGISFSRKANNYLVLKGSQWIYWIENNGRRIYRMDQLNQETPKDSSAEQDNQDNLDNLDYLGYLDRVTNLSNFSNLSALSDSSTLHIQEELRTIFQLCLRQQSLRKIVVEAWNGTKITEAPQREYLEQLGAERDRNSFVLWPSQLG